MQTLSLLTNQLAPVCLARSEEFIVKYIETKNRLQERKDEVMRNIVDHHRQQEEVKFKL